MGPAPVRVGCVEELPDAVVVAGAAGAAAAAEPWADAKYDADHAALVWLNCYHRQQPDCRL